MKDRIVKQVLLGGGYLWREGLGRKINIADVLYILT
jgi:hypothetical protein